MSDLTYEGIVYRPHPRKPWVKVSKCGKVLYEYTDGEIKPLGSIYSKNIRQVVLSLNPYLVMNVDRLVLDTYDRPAEKGFWVRYLDGDFMNCHIDNLRWSTFEEREQQRKQKELEELEERSIGINLAEELANFSQNLHNKQKNPEVVKLVDTTEPVRRVDSSYYNREEINEDLKEATFFDLDLFSTRNGRIFRKYMNYSQNQGLSHGTYLFKELNQYVNEYGDLYVYVKKGKTTQQVPVKRIVARAWVDCPDELKGDSVVWVDFKDGDRMNCHKDNLKWIPSNLSKH